MRVNNIQSNQKSEIIATNRKPAFQANTKAVEKVPSLLPQEVINHFGLNMETAVKYAGPKSYTPAPETVGETLMGYFHQLKIDWETHVDPKLPKEKF